MKTVKQIMLVVLGLLFFALQGCSHDDYIPVPGPAGTDGTNGVAGTASCESCHSVEHITPISDAYKLSGHYLGNTVARSGPNTTFSDGSLNGNGAFCSSCHSQEGYIDNAKYGKPNPTGYNNLSKISCEACHGVTHRSFNFTKDGNDFGLRQIAATTQKINPAFTLNASPTGGNSTSNTCLSCHQVRPDSNGFYKRPVIESGEKDFDDAVVITGGATPMYRFWSERALAKAMPGYLAGTSNYKAYSNTGIGVHDSSNGDIWMGITGIDIEGTTTHLPASKTAAHYKSNSCVSCHMDKPKADGTGGSHTLAITFQTCISCHTSAANAEALLTSFHTDYAAKLETLRKALSAKTLYFTTNATSGSIGIKFPTLPTVTGSTDPTVWDIERTDFPLKYAQAYWNYKLLLGDFSNGVHNPLYVKALIQNSIEALQ